MTAVLAACGGGNDDDKGPEDKPQPRPDAGGNTGGAVGGTAVANADYKVYSRTDPIAKMDSPQSVTVPVNAAGNILGNVSIGNVSGNLTPTTGGGYMSTGSFSSVVARGPGSLQLCSGGKAIFVLVPSDAVLAKVSELEGQTFNSYEDCKQPSARFTFNSGGTATVTAPGENMSLSKDDVAKLTSSGMSDSEGVTAFRSYKLKNGQYVLVEHGTAEGGYVVLWARN